MNEKLTGYVYNMDTREVIAEVSGQQANIEQYVEATYDADVIGLTYSPAFGATDGLIETSSADIIDADTADF